MKLLTTLAVALSGVSIVNALSAEVVEKSEFSVREPAHHVLSKRRGGGRSGGYTSTGGGRSGGGSSSKPPPSTLGSSNKGGLTSGGSGISPSFAGGKFYSGGAKVPFTAGKASPGGIKPTSLSKKKAGGFFAGGWLFGAYAYPYSHPIIFRNITRDNATQKESLICMCQKYLECGCDDNTNKAYVDDLVGDGSYDGLDHSVVQTGKWKGKPALFVNGTLANGTTASSFATGSQSMFSHASWAVVGAALAYSVWLI